MFAVRHLARLFVAITATGFLASSAFAAPVTIDFNGLGADGDHFPGYSESGFSVAVTAGTFDISNGSDFADPVPDIYTFSSGTIAVTDGGTPFSFTSVDLGAFDGSNIAYTFTGLLNGAIVFSQSGVSTFPAAETFDLVSSLHPTSSINSLSIHISSTSADGIDIDNIALNTTPASVTPEPSSLMLLGTGVLGVLGAARRRMIGR